MLEHLEWCKARAREYLERGQIQEALTSMLSDLKRHKETLASGDAMGPLAIMLITHQDKDGARRFIEGFR